MLAVLAISQNPPYVGALHTSDGSITIDSMEIVDIFKTFGLWYSFPGYHPLLELN